MILSLFQLRKNRFKRMLSHKIVKINYAKYKNAVTLQKYNILQRYKMLRLNLPTYDTKITTENGKLRIFDILRKSHVALTPEEWVRQHFVHYLISEKGYPASLMANETAINLNNIKLRCDTVIYDKNLTPRAIVEYKAPSVTISKNTFSQIARYNLVLKVDYLIISNGLKHYCCKMDYATNNYTFLLEIPDYHTIIAEQR